MPVTVAPVDTATLPNVTLAEDSRPTTESRAASRSSSGVDATFGPDPDPGSEGGMSETGPLPPPPPHADKNNIPTIEAKAKTRLLEFIETSFFVCVENLRAFCRGNKVGSEPWRPETTPTATPAGGWSRRSRDCGPCAPGACARRTP